MEVQVPAQNPRRQVTRAVLASTVGTAIEWYDFFLYGTAAALVFPKLFFPKSDQSASASTPSTVRSPTTLARIRA
jgi:hypothetical protein